MKKFLESGEYSNFFSHEVRKSEKPHSQKIHNQKTRTMTSNISATKRGMVYDSVLSGSRTFDTVGVSWGKKMR